MPLTIRVFRFGFKRLDQSTSRAVFFLLGAGSSPVVVQQLERLAEGQGAHEIVLQKRAGKTQLKLRDLVEFLQLLRLQFKLQATQIVLELLGAAGSQDGDDLCL